MTNIENISEKKAQGILIWGESNRTNELEQVVFELASKARELSEKLENKTITIITPGSTIINDEVKLKLKKAGANELVIIDCNLLNSYNTKNYATAILEYLKNYPKEIFLIGATRQGRDLAPNISSACQTGLTADCTGLEINENGKLAATRPTFGGELMATILCKTFPQMATVRPNVFKIKEIPTNELLTTNLFYVEIKNSSAKKILNFFPKNIDPNILENSKIILAGGKGLKDKATFQKLETLATLLNAGTGATRKAVDSGLAPHTAQIGQTGKTVSPDLYIAFGISGAIQHCVGISGAKKIIAVNCDSNAPITKQADLTIIADTQTVIEEMLNELQYNSENSSRPND